VLAITSIAHLQYFLDLISEPQDGVIPKMGAVGLNRTLLKFIRQKINMEDWSTQEITYFLYSFSDPRQSKRIIIVSAGEQSEYWEDCLKNSYICVGWDDVGNLDIYESKESFTDNFIQNYPNNGNLIQARRQAQELWMLRELETGDLIIANHGISKILTIGTVKEPGYHWNAGRQKARHTVSVDWDTAVTGEIGPQKRWGSVTVLKVSNDLYRQILALRKIVIGGPKLSSIMPIEPVFLEISEALNRKGQVILYGPPGTGKTYTINRFAD